MSCRRSLFFGPCLLAASACASASVPFSFPDASVAEVAAPRETPALSADGRVTLDQVLAHAQRHAADIVAARAGRAMGDAEHSAASLFRYDPVVELGLGVRTQRGGFGLDAQVEVSQQVELGRRRRARVEAAQWRQQLADVRVEAARWSVHAEVHLAYGRALLAADARALAQRRLELAQTLRSMVETKVAAGEEPSLALEVAGAELALARSAATAAESSVRTARIALAQAAGVTDRSLTPAAKADALVLLEPTRDWLDRGGGDGVQLRRAALEVQAAQSRVDVARMEVRPAPRFGVRYEREGSTSRPGNPNPASNIVMGTVAVSIPAFHGDRGALARRRAEAEVARAQQRAVEIEFDQQVRIACVRVEAAATRVFQLRQDVAAAFERALAGIERAYAVGERDFVSVAQSMQRLWSAREEVLVARGDYHVAVADLERLVGPLKDAGAR